MCGVIVVIGCPFGMIRTFWLEYFVRRQSRDGVPERWYRIYSRFGLLGSNFRDDDREAAADQALAKKKSAHEKCRLSGMPD